MATTTNSSPPPHTSSYRVKFKREDFLQLIKVASPEFLFHTDRIFFFAFQGFVVYSLECKLEDFEYLHIPILHAIEFSNTPWSER
jgi:hypothetical protein